LPLNGCFQSPLQTTPSKDANTMEALDAELKVPKGRNFRSANCRISIVNPLFT
jgi:hypothetical protein